MCVLRDGCYLQLSESVVTLLLTRSLLCAHGDELVDAVCDCPVDIEAQGCKSQTGSKKTGNQRDGEKWSLPSGGCQLVLEVGGAGVSGQGFGCQQQLAG